MAAPTSLANSVAQALDTLYAADGTPLLKLGIGAVTPTGLTPAAGWQGAATHVDGAPFNTGADGISLAGVLDASGNAIALAVDGAGQIPVIAGPSDTLLTAILAALTAVTPTTFVSFSATVITSETTIWTPASGKKFRLLGYVITQGVATGNVTLRDNTAGATILVIPAQTTGIVQVSPPLGSGILSAAANNVLTAQGVSTETISGYLFGTEV